MLPDRHQIIPVPDSPPFQILLTNGSQDPSDTVTAATMTGFADKKRKNPFIEFMRFPKNMKVESQETRIGFGNARKMDAAAVARLEIDPANFMFAITVERTM
ncbi:6419_t:CDS:2 [Paraglomus occultum]|uniref:6419_t:CDS:1 n=1 Tax=Paraglomus occultum TaxID=144539 RepID=A0A9N9AXU3_9GLOM|nr:6419_t:CDS:2 [Paraglomus occultum]